MKVQEIASHILFVVAAAAVVFGMTGERGADSQAVSLLERRVSRLSERVSDVGRAEIEQRVLALRQRFERLGNLVLQLESAGVRPPSEGGAPPSLPDDVRARLGNRVEAAEAEFVRDTLERVAGQVGLAPRDLKAVAGIYADERREVRDLYRRLRMEDIDRATLDRELASLRESRESSIRGIVGDETFEKIRNVMPETPDFSGDGSR